MLPLDSEDSFDMDYTVFKGIKLKEEDAREAAAAKKAKDAEEYAAR